MAVNSSEGIFANSRKAIVYFNMGRFDDGSKTPKMVKAPFDIVHMPSMAGFQALLDDEERQAGRYHRLAALAHNYSMITYPLINNLPGGSDDPER